MWLCSVYGDSSALYVGSCERIALLDTLQSCLKPPLRKGGGGWRRRRKKPLITVKCSVGFGPLTAHYWFPCFKSDNEWLNVWCIYLHGNGNWAGYHSLIRGGVIKLSSDS
jgi:hypothetical protein